MTLDASRFGRLYSLAYDDAPRPTIVLDASDGTLLVNRAARALPAAVLDGWRAACAGPALARLRDEAARTGEAHAELRVGAWGVVIRGRLHGAQLIVQARTFFSPEAGDARGDAPPPADEDDRDAPPRAAWPAIAGGARCDAIAAASPALRM